MRRPFKASPPRLSTEAQRLIALSQSISQSGSRLEERVLEQQLELSLQKLLKTSHQDTIDNTLNSLFKDDLNAYDVLLENAEAVSESSTMTELVDGVETTWQALLVAAPVLAWTRFSIGAGAIPGELLTTLSAHFGAHLLAANTRLALAPHLYSIDQLPHTHAEAYAMTHKLAQSAFKGSHVKPTAKQAETAPFLADTRYLLGVVVAPKGAPIFRWQESEHLARFADERSAALGQWREQASASISRLLPGCGVELLLPEAYYVACREADKRIRPVSIRAAVHYLTHTLGIEAADLRAVVAGFGEENADGQIDEYRVGFTLRQEADVMYGIVWPLYGQEDEDGTPVEGLAALGMDETQKTPVDDIVACLNEAGITHIKKHGERYVTEFCDDCGAPLFADPTGELVHPEMPDDAPAGNEHFH
ncbi:DUF2863 family protein [Massilia sp. PWRC2]|uniref:DUF2863 family protein n=1 Tax=Massilia sp. PWRC2 TaxID=2804626 RepID=UPI003CEBF688